MLWIVIDEANTFLAQAIIAELTTRGRSSQHPYLRDLVKNVRFVIIQNPYNPATTNQAQVTDYDTLQSESDRSLESILQNKVNPTNESFLESFVIEFSQSTSNNDDEKKFIRNTIENQLHQNEPDSNSELLLDLLTITVSDCQDFVQQSIKTQASRRDVERFIRSFFTCFTQIYKGNVLRAYAITVWICYLNRIQS